MKSCLRVSSFAGFFEFLLAIATTTTAAAGGGGGGGGGRRGRIVTAQLKAPNETVDREDE